MKTFRSVAFVAALATIAACGSERDAQPRPEPGAGPVDPGPLPAAGPARIVLQLGDDLAPAIRERVAAHLTAHAKVTVVKADDALDTLDPGASVVAIGETWAAR